MPKIVTRQTILLDCERHRRAARDATTDVKRALEVGSLNTDDYEAAKNAAKRLEAAGCYIRRAIARLEG